VDPAQPVNPDRPVNPDGRASSGNGDANERLASFLAAQQATRAAAASVDRWVEPYREAARDAVSQLALDEMLRHALEGMTRALGADAVSLLIANGDGTELVARAAIGLDRDLETGLGIAAGAGVSGRVLASGAPLILEDLSTAEVVSQTLRTSGLRSYVGVPLSTEQPLGVLHATSRRPGAFTESDAEMLALFAGPIASAIERVRLFEEERSLRRAAEEASLRAERAVAQLRGLQRITASLASASTVEEVCGVILGAVAPGLATDAERGIWMLRDSRLVLVAGQETSAAYQEIPLDPSLPAAENLRSGDPLFVESRAELVERWPRLADGPTESFAGLPLIVAGRRLGVMALGFRTEHVFDEAERRYLATVADQAAEALQRADDRASLEAAREVAEERRERLDFLARASERLAESLDLEVTLQTVAELGVPRLADRCAVYLLDETRILKHVLAPRLNDDERQLFESTEPTLSAPSGIGAVIRTGRAEYFPRIDDAMLVAGARTDDELALLRRVGFGGSLTIPLRARGRNLGAVAFVNRAGRELSVMDRGLAEELAARAAVTIDNALLYRREAEVSARFAATLLPLRLPSIPGLDIAARYKAGSKTFDVGGDFYDVWPAGDGAWFVMVGDVQGKGVEAAALTSFARYTVKSAAMAEPSPAGLLAHLNDAMIRNFIETARDTSNPWHDARLCTCLLIRVEYGSTGWTATVSSGGHPLPLLREAGGGVSTLGRPGILLGVSETASYGQWSMHIGSGSRIVCFTDGLLDRSGETDGPATILSGLDASAGDTADAIFDAAPSRDTSPDDLVVLALAFE
jgi:GAF domain-containing protein